MESYIILTTDIQRPRKQFYIVNSREEVIEFIHTSNRTPIIQVVLAVHQIGKNELYDILEIMEESTK